MQDIALDVAGGSELLFARADASFSPATDDRLFGKHVAGDDGFFTDDQRSGADIAIDLAVDRDVACRDEGSPYGQFGADDGWYAPVAARALGGNWWRRRPHRSFGLFTLSEPTGQPCLTCPDRYALRLGGD